MKNCINIKNLSHAYHKRNVLENIHLSVPEGSLFGFLGPNGAGKTTALKLIVGLMPLQKGDVSVFGKSIREKRIEILHDIGCLIDSPSFYAHLTAGDNMIAFRNSSDVTTRRVREVLEFVRLEKYEKIRVSDFSLGMKQRLALAISLLNDPKLLVLDEPTNGLDPAGISEIRNLLLSLVHEKKITVLVSSHLLFEIEKMCTHIAIIDSGNMRFQGTLAELKGGMFQEQKTIISTNDNEQAYQLLKNHFPTLSLIDNKLLLTGVSKHDLKTINAIISQNNLFLTEIRDIQQDLESIFKHVTSNENKIR